jgi:exosortase C (VPDSG-CTERM-specific)
MWLVATLTYCIVLAAVFAVPVGHLMIYAIGSDLHSHIVLVPLITAYLLWIRRSVLPAPGDPALWLALPFAAVGVASLGVAWSGLGGTFSENDQVGLVGLAFFGLLVAGGCIFLGRSWMKEAAFPVLFLLFMIPLPDAAVEWLETASKLASAEAAAAFFSLTGTPFLRNGVYFQLPNISIEVARECSGIRSSWVLFITSLLASYLFLRSPWRRAVLVAFVIPLGVLRNGFRIFVIGTLCIRYGPQMIDSPIHHRGGPIFFVLSLFPLFALAWWLRRREIGIAPQGPVSAIETGGMAESLVKE